MLTFLACGAGIYFGLYFNVLALLPLSFLMAGIIMTSSLAIGHGGHESVSTTALALIASQLGYMLGLSARELYGHLCARLSFGPSRRI